MADATSFRADATQSECLRRSARGSNGEFIETGGNEINGLAAVGPNKSAVVDGFGATTGRETVLALR